MEELLRQIRALEKRIQMLESHDTSRIVALTTNARVLNDAVNRNGGYSVTVTCFSNAGLPANGFYGIWYSASFVAATAAVQYGAQIFDPDGTGTGTIASYAAAIGDRIVGGGFVKLNASGQFTLTLIGATVPSVSAIIVDVYAYLA